MGHRYTQFLLMQKIFQTILLLLSGLVAHAQKQIVSFKISKPYNVLEFVETAAGRKSGHSSTLYAYINQQIPKSDTAFQKLIDEFNDIVLYYSYKRSEFPESRRQYRSTYDLICIAAVQSNTFAEFKNRTAGILPNSEHQKLFRILTTAEKYYDRVIWSGEKEKTEAQVKALQTYQEQCNQLFNTFRNFYNSSWTDDMPFSVAIYPIPGKRGNSTATPHANSLCVGVLSGETEHVQRIGVVLHEICHVLYDEQTSSFQHHLDSAFNQSASPYRTVAYTFFDEALATAMGNAYVYEFINKKTDTTEWYNNVYINGYAHALYPLVKRYLTGNKKMDHAFVEEAIAIFGKTFPKATKEYAILLNNVQIYGNAESAKERNQLIATIEKYFQLSHYGVSCPVTDEYSLELLQKTEETQLIVIYKDQEPAMAKLAAIFPEINSCLSGKKDREYVLGFFDKNRRPVIVVNTASAAAVDKAMNLIHTRQYMEEPSYIPLP